MKVPLNIGRIPFSEVVPIRECVIDVSQSDARPERERCIAYILRAITV